MSSRIRFSRALDVFEAFKELHRFVALPEDEIDPLGYVRRLLESGRRIDAVTFLAYVLPRREAVWWGRKCLSAILGPAADDDAARAAEAWVRAPEEENRRAALALGTADDALRPTTWLALAAGRSGGSITAPEQTPISPAPEACAQSVNAAIVLAISVQDPPAIGEWIKACVEAGIRFAEGGEARVAPPRRSSGA